NLKWKKNIFEYVRCPLSFKNLEISKSIKNDCRSLQGGGAAAAASFQRNKYTKDVRNKKQRQNKRPLQSNADCPTCGIEVPSLQQSAPLPKVATYNHERSATCKDSKHSSTLNGPYVMSVTNVATHTKFSHPCNAHKFDYSLIIHTYI
ncbi:hypothetical protein RFI_39405, partial [Reticulomyxa filosa]